MSIRKIILTLLSFLYVMSLKAEIRLPAIISDNMVLQRETEVLLWGYASGKKNIIIEPSWSKERYVSDIDDNGYWKIKIKTGAAGGPYKISFKAGDESKTVNNVLLGEVWLCGGQSNMDISFRGLQNQPINNAAIEIVDSNYPDLRLFRVNRDYNDRPQSDCRGAWKVSSTQSAETFSAIGFIFGRELQKRLGVPVGMIACCWGGSKVEAWMSEENLRQFIGKKHEGPINPKRANVTPSALFNGMLYPIIGFTIKGCLFYQGEANITDPYGYREKFPSMVKEWRARWGYEFPFYYAQLAPFSYDNMGWGSEQTQVALFREIQHQCLQDIPNGGIVPTVDVGAEYTIHPPDKKTVAMRFLLQAMSKAYGMKGFVADGPVFKSMETLGEKLRIHFDNAPYGLSSYGKEITGFEIAGSDRVFYPAEAHLSGRSMIDVQNDKVKNPVAVRYCWKNCLPGNLYNNYGIAVLPFRSDNWDFCSYAQEPVTVIFETDMGNDIDDALALDMLYKYQDKGLADIALISVNKRYGPAVPFIRLMNSFYGYGDIPVAIGDTLELPDQKLKDGPYTQKVISSGLFPVRTETGCDDAVKKYREILSAAKDGSVVIISVGFMTNLRRLLQSGPDETSDMTGQELVANKVRMLSLMGGCFNSRSRREFNVRFDVLSARYVFDNWPTDIIVSPWELGARIFFRAEVLQGLRYASPHPLDVAYRNFLQMPYDRECWDLTSVIAGVDGCNGQFHTSRKGHVEVSDDGVTVFVPDPDGKVTVLSVMADRRKDLEAFIETVISAPPKIFRSQLM